MKTKLTAITIPNNITETPDATFIKDGEFKTIPKTLSEIEDFLCKKNYTYDVCQHPDCKIIYNFKSERDEIIDKLLYGDDTTKWVVSEVFAPGMKII